MGLLCSVIMAKKTSSPTIWFMITSTKKIRLCQFISLFISFMSSCLFSKLILLGFIPVAKFQKLFKEQLYFFCPFPDGDQQPRDVVVLLDRVKIHCLLEFLWLEHLVEFIARVALALGGRGRQTLGDVQRLVFTHKPGAGEYLFWLYHPPPGDRDLLIVYAPWPQAGIDQARRALEEMGLTVELEESAP